MNTLNISYNKIRWGMTSPSGDGMTNNGTARLKLHIRSRREASVKRRNTHKTYVTSIPLNTVK